MSGWNIRFPKDHMARAEVLKKEAFAIGYNGHGRAEALMWLDAENATFLWLFAHEINRGKTPAEAFAEVERKLAEHAAKRAAKEAAKQTTPV